MVGAGTALSAVVLADETTIPVEALYLVPQSVQSSPIASQLGLDMQDTPIGPMIVTDEARMTKVTGVYAAGDIARAPHSVGWAVADGVTAGISVHRRLVFGG